MGIRRFLQRRNDDAALAREIEAHVAIETDENIARGMDAVEARRRALVKFGSAGNVREDVWEWNTIGVLEDLSLARYFSVAMRRTTGNVSENQSLFQEQSRRNRMLNRVQGVENLSASLSLRDCYK